MRGLILLLLWSLALAAQAIEAEKLVRDARQQIGVTLSYDPAYRQLSYPGGDVPMATGVCTDVVIRALRQQGLDLQEAVHRDMRGSFSVYPKNWGLNRPDSNIDHRRVPNLMTWFKRRAGRCRLARRLRRIGRAISSPGIWAVVSRISVSSAIIGRQRVCR